MKMPIILMLFAVLISLNACSSMSGNVVPKSGPAMEKVYDSMNNQDDANDSDKSNQFNNVNSKQNLKKFRENNIAIQNASSVSNGFHKIPNPELRMYIYPHLAGRDQIPVPGYTTEFNVYERDYYEI